MLDERVVVNAISYRAAFFCGRELFGTRSICGRSQLRQVRAQEPEPHGSWDYAGAHFVDGYHTCFVLKNLLSAMDVLSGPTSVNAAWS